MLVHDSCVLVYGLECEARWSPADDAATPERVDTRAHDLQVNCVRHAHTAQNFSSIACGCGRRGHSTTFPHIGWSCCRSSGPDP